jgi:hypothetical protein
LQAVAVYSKYVKMAKPYGKSIEVELFLQQLKSEIFFPHNLIAENHEADQTR